MMAHELLRQAALILAQGWSKGCDARDATWRIVPLYVGAHRAKINPGAGRVILTGGLLDRAIGRERHGLGTDLGAVVSDVEWNHTPYHHERPILWTSPAQFDFTC
jgi:hypothetical protein